MPNQHVEKILNKQDKELELAEKKCISQYGERVLNDVNHLYQNLTNESCPPIWDKLLCWPKTTAGTLVTQACPPHYTGYDINENATRMCMTDGRWFFSEEYQSHWANYSTCAKSNRTTVIIAVNQTEIPEIYNTYIPVVNIISTTGYSLSLVTLITAFIIMLSIRKLHCARNILHMHLFASFILRAFTYLILKMSFINNLGLPSDLIDRNGDCYYITTLETNNWACKLMTSMWQYSITANYSWILMEGIYLHNLIFRALFADSSNSILYYVIFGWSLPLVIIVFWIMARLMFEDAFCWTTHEDSRIYKIIEFPTILSMVINLIVFVRISLLLYKKLRSPINQDTQRYQKWVKSTLVLVPLFGVHYVPFLILYYSSNDNSVMSVVWLMCDRLCGSFQGFFVAILYCFLNGEVKIEIKPLFSNFITFLTAHSCCKHIFPYRIKFFRSEVVRNSVCTTMSCSSLYTNGVLHRNSKSRLDSYPKAKQFDRVREHICHNGSKSLQELPTHKQGFNSSANLLMAETTLCLGNNNPEKCVLQSVKIEKETAKMVQND